MKRNGTGTESWKYWDDLRTEKEILVKHQLDGGFIVTWGFFYFNDMVSLVYLSINLIQCQVYKLFLIVFHLLRNFWQEKHGYNGEIIRLSHTSHEAKLMKPLDKKFCKGCSEYSNLNPTDNVWGYLARRFYKNVRHFSPASELRTMIEEEWEENHSGHWHK